MDHGACFANMAECFRPSMPGYVWSRKTKRLSRCQDIQGFSRWPVDDRQAAGPARRAYAQMIIVSSTMGPVLCRLGRSATDDFGAGWLRRCLCDAGSNENEENGTLPELLDCRDIAASASPLGEMASPVRNHQTCDRRSEPCSKFGTVLHGSPSGRRCLCRRHDGSRHGHHANLAALRRW